MCVISRYLKATRSGCEGGPSRHKNINDINKAIETLLSMADDRKVLDNLKNYPTDKFSMHRDGTI